MQSCLIPSEESFWSHSKCTLGHFLADFTWIALANNMAQLWSYTVTPSASPMKINYVGSLSPFWVKIQTCIQGLTLNLKWESDAIWNCILTRVTVKVPRYLLQQWCENPSALANFQTMQSHSSLAQHFLCCSKWKRGPFLAFRVLKYYGGIL